MPTTQEQAVMAMRIRQKLALLKPEERLSLGLGTSADSVKLGLRPRSTDYGAALERVTAGEGSRPDSMKVGLLPSLRAESAKEEALKRLVDSGQLSSAAADSSLAGIRAERPAKEPSDKKQALNNLVGRGELSPSQADSAMAGLKAPPDVNKQDFLNAQRVYNTQYVDPGSGVIPGSPDFMSWYYTDWPYIQAGKRPPDRGPRAPLGGRPKEIPQIGNLKAVPGSAKTDTTKTSKPSWRDYR